MAWTLLPASELPRHRVTWDALNATCGGCQLLDSIFIDAALHHFSTGEEVLAIHDRGEAVDCIALLKPRSRFSWQTFQPANAPLGCWITTPGAPLQELASTLLRELGAFPLLLGITQLDPALFPRPAPSSEMGQLNYIETPRLTVSGSFDDYWQSRSKNQRHNIQRQLNRMQREALPARFEIIESTDLMAQCVADYAELEARGWKGREQTAVTPGDAQAAFYTQILQAYAALGEASVWRYFLGDRLAASNLCIQRNGVLIVLKTAYDESFKGFSPAQMMNYEALRRVFDSGLISRIEFYGPVKEWHTKLTSETRRMYHLNIYRGAWVKSTLTWLRRHKHRKERAPGADPVPQGMGRHQ
jgi:CelD/BcsL family acetyltransferase involved in cellulose biosynthesis